MTTQHFGKTPGGRLPAAGLPVRPRGDAPLAPGSARRATVIFTGASGSMRGRPGFGGLQRHPRAGCGFLVQSMAREFVRQGIPTFARMSLIDGAASKAIGLLLAHADPAPRRMAPTAWDEVEARFVEEYWHLHKNSRGSAGTPEIRSTA